MKKELKTLEEIRIYSDPYRIQIMNEFKNMGRPSTVKEIADVMHEVPAKVYYHVKKLESIGLLHLVNTKLVNGITAKFYEPFKGLVHIKKSEVDETIKQVFQSETEKLISHFYDENKKQYLESTRTGSATGQLSSEKLYLTKKEAEEFSKWIAEFCEKHQDKQSEQTERYDLFMTIIKNESESS